ncbi:hypothetical protein V9L05_20445 [Bernardetia sp. Wsw4-3y2]|uniref:hypothetical protein n=1 Tax=Bernardetia sp. Wsw4-3y2 TaxID=3127471 RepID=UPI0030D384AE
MKSTIKQKNRIIVITNLCWQDASKKRSELVYPYDVAKVTELDYQEAQEVITDLLQSEEYNSLLRMRAKVEYICQDMGYNSREKIDTYLIKNPNIPTKKRLDYIERWNLNDVITSLEIIREHNSKKLRSQMRASK